MKYSWLHATDSERVDQVSQSTHSLDNLPAYSSLSNDWSLGTTRWKYLLFNVKLATAVIVKSIINIPFWNDHSGNNNKLTGQQPTIAQFALANIKPLRTAAEELWITNNFRRSQPLETSRPGSLQVEWFIVRREGWIFEQAPIADAFGFQFGKVLCRSSVATDQARLSFTKLFRKMKDWNKIRSKQLRKRYK